MVNTNKKILFPQYIYIFSSFLIRSIFVLICFLTFQVQAQDPSLKEIKGRVSDSQGEPVIQAAIIESGTKNGTVTDVNGNFVLRVNANAKLLISSIGFESQEVDILGKGESISIILKEDAKALDEVVVIGYGTTKRSEFTGAANVVDMDAMLKTPVGSITEGLAGRAPGVQVSTQDGQPGVESDVVIRGASSMSQSNSPLYVVDGIPIEDFDQASLNPNDIESMSILKDASSTSIYGARGTNGVIVITTKKGTEGRPIVSWNGSIGFQQPTKLIEVMSPYEFLKYQYERDPLFANSYYFYDGKTLEDYRNAEPINFQDHLFRTATLHNHNISIRGGSRETTRYNASFSTYIQDGIIINSGYNKYQGRLSLDQVINKKIKVGVSVNYSDMMTHGRPVAMSEPGGSGRLTLTNSLFVTVWGYRPVAGRDSTDFLNEDVDPLYESMRVNPITATKNEFVKKKWNTFIGNANVDYEIIKNLVLRITGGIYRNTTKNERFFNSKTVRGRPHRLNVRGINADVSNRDITSLNNENTLSYRLRLKRKHNFDFLIGQSMSKAEGMRYGFTSMFIPSEELGMSGIDDGIISLPLADPTLDTRLSYFGRVNYHYSGRYVFSATVRRDGSSRFPKGGRWGTFPSASFAWNATNEKFMRQLKIISNLRLRFSHGITGNSRVSDFAYLAGIKVNTFNPAYSFNNAVPSPGMRQSSMENNNLRWESSPQTDIGIDLGLFKNRIKITADMYRKLTNGLLMNVDMPSNAPVERVFMNSGQIENRGWEFELKTINVSIKNFNWVTDFNISQNINKVLKLADNHPVLYSHVYFNSQFNMPAYVSTVGKPMGQFWGYIHDGNYQFEDFDNPEDGVYILKEHIPTNGSGVLRTSIQPGDIKYKDLDGDKEITAADRDYIGSPFPKFIGGLANDFTFKNFDLNVFLQWSYGNKVLNANRLILEGNATQLESFNQFASYVDRWTPENPTNKNFRTGGQGPIGYSSRVIEDGSFLRLRAITFGYRLPETLLKKVGIEDARFSLSANNLITWTKYSGHDPEVSSRNSSILTQGFDFSSYPRNRVITFGLNVTF